MARLDLSRSLRRGRPRVQLTVDPERRQVPAGAPATFLLRVEVRRGPPVLLRLVVTGLSDGWRAHLPARRLLVETGRAVHLVLSVRAPAGAELGSRQTFQVSARPLEGRGVDRVVEAVVTSPAVGWR